MKRKKNMERGATKQQEYSVCLKKEYETRKVKLYSLFKNLTVFQLTGADIISCDFKKSGIFKLEFTNRGIISGHFIEIIKNKKIKLEWNVEGFGRENEYHTQVDFEITSEKEKSLLQLNHSKIKSKDLVPVKTKAWSEILDDLEEKLKGKS
ncbi:MAG: SRPBCC domain-containing protein [Bacteroidota bacterium]